jgi:hypothetical protein
VDLDFFRGEGEDEALVIASGINNDGEIILQETINFKKLTDIETYFEKIVKFYELPKQ